MVRFKNRYITVEIITKDKDDKPLSFKTNNTLQNTIERKIQLMYGDFGVAAVRAGFSARYCNEVTRIALIKCRHGPHKFVINAIPTITDMAGRFVSIEILYVGATMKNCFLFIKKYQRKKLESMWSTLRNDKEKQEMIEALMTLTPAIKSMK